MYTNVDNVFLNKRSEFLTVIKERKPKIITLTEIKAKNQSNVNLPEYSVPGYDLFVNRVPKRGVAIYTSKSVNAAECEELNGSVFQESVWCNFTSANEEKVLIGCIYKSPNSTEENIQELLNLMKRDLLNNYDKICIVGDFNYQSVRWDGEWSIKDNEFVECVWDAFLTQMVKKKLKKKK